MGLAQFVREYTTVRRAEGWGSYDPDYYRALPYEDLTGRYREIWRIRARSFDVFVQKVLAPLEVRHGTLKLVDIGAGNGWLGDRLARRGHCVTAIDVLEDALDGLGALRRYSRGVRPVMGEFDHLPLPDNVIELAVFNAAFHYSTNYATTLSEILRVLHPRGTLVILDSPMYSDPSSGAHMVNEREARFLKTYGFASSAVKSEHYLTSKRLDELAEDVGLDWRIYMPRLDLRTALTRRLNGIRARREPASFPVIVGTRA